MSALAAPAAPPAPGTPEALLEQAGRAEQEGRFDEANGLLDRVLGVAREHPGALHLKGVVSFRQGRRSEAAELMERSIQLDPGPLHYYRNICEVYRVLGRYDAALAAGRQALVRDPRDPHSLANLAVLQYERGDVADAIACAERAIELSPDLASPHFELAEALLLSGEFARGWEEYEWRFKLPGAGMLMPPTDRPQWDGKPLPDGTLLLIADQGFGDGIQFCRYMGWARGRCARLVVACSRELRPLLMQQGADLFFDRWEDAPPYAAFCPLSGLPRLAGTRLDSIPAPVPYLHAEPEQVAAWAHRLDRLTPPGYRRIGIVWAGRPAHNNDRNRSIRLRDLAPLAALERSVLVSLQKGPGQAQIGTYLGPAPLLNLGPELGDFADTAAVLESLDLVVTVDTAVGHLAGAMGRPVWVMLPYAPDWRWLRQRSDSPWYPTLRLFRQPAPASWPPVIAAVAEALASA